MKKSQKHSEKTKRKISLVNKGKSGNSTSFRKGNYSGKRFSKGQKAWNKGIPHTKETKEKIRLSETLFEKGHIPWSKGKENLHISSERHWNWKGGITPLTTQIRNCFQYRQWRSDVFTRDNFTCVICGLKGIYLEADHYPKTFSQIFQESKVKTLKEAENYEEFWNINNGRTVCKKHNPRGKRLFDKLLEE